MSIASQSSIPQAANREKLSVLVPTFNEEQNIEACLKSVSWADEIVVVDSFSTDRTREIAAKFTRRVIEHEYVNSASQKNWAIPQLTHDWVLIVDADERVTDGLRDEILQVLSAPSPFHGYRIYRANHFLGRRVRFCGWQTDNVLRLFRKSRGRYADKEVHADVLLDGQVGFLKSKLLHYTFRSFEHYLNKFDRYTSWAAHDRARTTKRVRWHHLALRPTFRFFKQYLLRLGFLDGMTGFILCTLSAYSVFLKYAKLWEIQNSAEKSASK